MGGYRSPLVDIVHGTHDDVFIASSRRVGCIRNLHCHWLSSLNEVTRDPACMGTPSVLRCFPSASSTRAWRASSNQSTPTVPHGACGTTASKILVDAVVQRVDELLGRRRSAFRLGRVIECGQFRAPTARAGPQERSCLLELLGGQELERRLTISNREKGHPVAPCVTSIRNAHDVENPEQVLRRDGIQSPAAGPGMNALGRYAEELAKLGPGQSPGAAQFGDRTSRSLAWPRRPEPSHHLR